jgi:hypothetical protein
MSVELYDSMHTVYHVFADVKCHKAPHGALCEGGIYYGREGLDGLFCALIASPRAA